VSFSRLSTGTKLASTQTQKKIQKGVRFGFSTDTKSSKTVQKNFSKNRQDVFSTRYQP
jgi:fructosamine-3-kinase